MDKKEVNKRYHSDGKKINISKTNLKNNHITPKSSNSKKVSYISRAKNVSIPFDKKYNIYATDTKSFLKQSCDKCRIGINSHMLVNSASVKSAPQLNKVESGHDLNGNLSFNPHAAFCNFPSEVPNFSLGYQSQQRYELSVQRQTKHKTRTGYHEKRTYNSKTNRSKIPFHSNKFFHAVPPTGIGYQKSSPASLSNSLPFIKLSTSRMCGDATIVADKLNQKCYIKPGELINDQYNTDVKVANFPVFAQSNLPNKTCFTFQVDPENQFRGIKKSDYFIQKWQQISVASLFENPADFKDGDKVLFPALPSNVHTGQIKFNSSFIGSMPSELSLDEHSYPESANSVSEVITTESPGTNPESNIPQASYADVIRMSVTCSKSSNCTIVNSDKISESNKNVSDHAESSEENSLSGGSDWVISKLYQFDHKSQDPKNVAHCNKNMQNSVSPHSIVVSLEKPSFYNSILQNSKPACLPVCHCLPSDRNSKSDNTNSLYNCEENVDKISSSSLIYSSCMPSDSICGVDGQAMCSKTDSLYSSASSASSSTNAFKSTEKKSVHKNIIKNKDSPVIIMNNCSSTEDGSEITFGIEYEEMIKLCFDDCDETNKNIFNAMETLEKCSLSEVNEGENLETDIQTLDDKCMSESKLKEDFLKNKLSFKDKELYWKETDVTYNQNNHRQLTEYFASMWKECEKDSGSSSNGDKIQIYQEL